MDPVEQQRVQRLEALHALDGLPRPALDDLVLLASRLAGMPFAAVGLVGEHLQWFPAVAGPEVPPMPRDVPLCDRVVRTGRELVEPDLRSSPDFHDHPLVAGPLQTASYAGFPLTTPDGFCVGTLCVLSQEQVVLDEDQQHGLRVLARQVMTELELRRLLHEQAVSQREFQLLAERASDVVSRHGLDGRTTWVSPSLRTVLGHDPQAGLTTRAVDLVHDDDQPLVAAALAAVQAGRTETVTVRSRHADGSWRWMETTLSPLLDDDSAVVEVYSAARDVTDRVQVTHAAAQAAEFVRAVVDTVAVGIVACDADGRLTLFNHATMDFHGIGADDTVDPSDWPRYFDLFRPDGTTLLPPEEVPLVRALRDGAVEDVEMLIAPHGLPPRLVRCDGRALRDEDGRTVGAVVAMTDITSARQSQERLRDAHDALSRSTDALRRSEAQFRSAFEDGPMAMCRLDADGVVVQANPAMRRLLSRRASSLTGSRLTSLAVPADRERLALALASAGGPQHGAVYVEARLRQADERGLWCEIAVNAATGLDGVPYLLVQIADVEDRKRRESDLERRASRDHLTGLANRAALQARLTELLDPENAGAPTSVLFLDLDGFKAVNDTVGHQVGDEVLVEVASRLAAQVRTEDLVARLGGDEFVVLRQDGDGRGPSRGGDLVARLERAMQAPFPTSAGDQRVGISIGLVTARCGDDPGEVLARADAAMYDAKRRLPAQRR